MNRALFKSTLRVIDGVFSRCYSIPRFKQRFSFVTPEYGNLYALLDAAKVADTLLLVPSTERGIDEFGDHCLSCLFAQGLPSSVFVTKVFMSSGLKRVRLKRAPGLYMQILFTSKSFTTLLRSSFITRIRLQRAVYFASLSHCKRDPTNKQMVELILQFLSNWLYFRKHF